MRNEVRRTMRIQRTLFVLAVPLLIIAFDHVAKGQESKPATNWEVKKLVYHVQSSGHSDVYVQDDPKMEVRQLVPGGQDPAWSSDGEKIAFLGSWYSHVGQHAMLAENEIGPSEWTVGGLSLAARQIQVINPDGSGTKQITNLSNGVWDFAWSPVENKIAYCELGKDGKTAIVVINADGSGRQELSKMGEIRCAVGMPVLQRTLDKNKFMVPGRVAGGKALIKLVGPQENTPASETASGELIGVPTLAWSPDGERIAFTSALNGKPVIGVVGKNGGNAKPVVLGYTARWSPDGKQLLFRHDSDTTPAVTSIWIINADGTQPRKILDKEDAEFGLTWFPDGKRIVFGSERENKKMSEIFQINADGTGLEKLASQDHFSLSSPAFSTDGTKLIVDVVPSAGALTKTHDSNIWVVDLASHRQEKLVKGSGAAIIWEKK